MSDPKVLKINFETPKDFFDDWDEYAQNKDLAEDPKGWRRFYEYDRHDNSWTGTTVQYLDSHKYGDTKIVKDAEQLKILPVFDLKGKNTNVLDDQDGDTLDMERYLDGEERCFIKRVRRAGNNRRRVFKILVSVGENCGVSSKRMLYKTYAAVRYADAIESQGNRAEIGICYKSVHMNAENQTAIITMKIKGPDEPVNLSLLAYLASPYFFRGYLLGVQSWAAKDVDSSLGRSETITEKDKIYDEDTLIINSGECLDEESANDWLEKHSCPTAEGRQGK